MAEGIKKDPYSLREIFERMELDLIASLKRNFFRHKNEELKEGFQWEQWQLVKLRNLVKYRKTNKDIIGEYNAPIENTINDVLQENFNIGENNVSKLVHRSGLKLPDEKDIPKQIEHPIEKPGMKSIGDILKDKTKPPVELPKAPPDTNFFGTNEKKLKALQDSVNGDMQEAQKAILRKMNDVYRQVIYKAETNMTAGVKTLNQAIDMATKEFLDKGLNCIQYKNGNRVNVASYAEMSLRTASQRATFLGEGKKRDEWGMHLVVVSAHANTCKYCLPWQGEILIDDVFSHGTKADGDYPLLSEAMKAGLLHPNCRHTLATYFPGITKLPESVDDKEAIKNYEAEQQQRYIERQIRKWKRIQAGSVDIDNEKFASDKVKEWQDKLKQHLEDNPKLRRDYGREKPGPGIKNKDIKVNAERLKLQAESGKIKQTKVKIINGEFSSKVRDQKQKEHVLGTKQWLNRAKEALSQGKIPQGAFNHNVDVQKLIDEHKTNGLIEFRGKDIYPREYVDTDTDVGVAFSRELNRYVKTSRIAIHYSSKGTHAYPVLPKKEE